jgi:hypothetical protein
VQQHPSQAGQGQRLGLSQSQATPGMPRRHPVVTQAFAHPERLPARTADAGAGMRAANRTPGVPRSPLVGLLVLSHRATAHPLPRLRRQTIAASRQARRSNPDGSSLRRVRWAAGVLPRQGRPMRTAWRLWQATPAPGAVVWLTSWGARALRALAARGSHRSQGPLGEPSPQRSKPPSGRSRPFASGSHTPWVVCNALVWSKTRDVSGRLACVRPSWKRVVDGITFAHSIDHGTRPTHKY